MEEQRAKIEDFNIADLITEPFEGGTRLVKWLSQRPWGVGGVPAAVLAGLGVGLPHLLAGRQRPQSARLARTAALLAGAGAGIDLGLTAALPALRLSYAPIRSAFLYLFLGRAALSGGVAVLGAVPALAGRDLRPGGRRTLARLLGAAHVAMTAFEVYATYLGAQHLELTRLALTFPGRTTGASPARLRLAHLSDIHIARLSRRDEAALADLRRTRPDLVCLTGDFLSTDYYDARAFGDLYRLLQGIVALGPRFGVFACLGNNDPAGPVRTVLQRAGVRVLDATAVPLAVDGRRIEVLGARTSASADWQTDLPRLREATADAAADGPADLRILLYHTPDLAPQAAAADVDLYLCGHTHGGQIRLPVVGALRTASRFGRRYVSGLVRLPNGGYIYTSRGVGFEGLGIPSMRVLCPPQVTVFDLTIGCD